MNENKHFFRTLDDREMGNVPVILLFMYHTLSNPTDPKYGARIHFRLMSFLKLSYRQASFKTPVVT